MDQAPFSSHYRAHGYNPIQPQQKRHMPQPFSIFQCFAHAFRKLPREPRQRPPNPQGATPTRTTIPRRHRGQRLRVRRDSGYNSSVTSCGNSPPRSQSESTNATSKLRSNDTPRGSHQTSTPGSRQGSHRPPASYSPTGSSPSACYTCQHLVRFAQHQLNVLHQHVELHHSPSQPSTSLSPSQHLIHNVPIPSSPKTAQHPSLGRLPIRDDNTQPARRHTADNLIGNRHTVFNNSHNILLQKIPSQGQESKTLPSRKNTPTHGDATVRMATSPPFYQGLIPFNVSSTAIGTSPAWPQ